jgi:DNA replication protein DnaC
MDTEINNKNLLGQEAKSAQHPFVWYQSFNLRKKRGKRWQMSKLQRSLRRQKINPRGYTVYEVSFVNILVKMCEQGFYDYNFNRQVIDWPMSWNFIVSEVFKSPWKAPLTQFERQGLQRKSWPTYASNTIDPENLEHFRYSRPVFNYLSREMLQGQTGRRESTNDFTARLAVEFEENREYLQLWPGETMFAAQHRLGIADMHYQRLREYVLSGTPLEVMVAEHTQQRLWREEHPEPTFEPSNIPWEDFIPRVGDEELDGDSDLETVDYEPESYESELEPQSGIEGAPVKKSGYMQKRNKEKRKIKLQSQAIWRKWQPAGQQYFEPKWMKPDTDARLVPHMFSAASSAAGAIDETARKLTREFSSDNLSHRTLKEEIVNATRDISDSTVVINAATRNINGEVASVAETIKLVCQQNIPDCTERVSVAADTMTRLFAKFEKMFDVVPHIAHVTSNGGIGLLIDWTLWFFDVLNLIRQGINVGSLISLVLRAIRLSGGTRRAMSHLSEWIDSFNLFSSTNEIQATSYEELTIEPTAGEAPISAWITFGIAMIGVVALGTIPTKENAVKISAALRSGTSVAALFKMMPLEQTFISLVEFLPEIGQEWFKQHLPQAWFYAELKDDDPVVKWMAEVNALDNLEIRARMAFDGLLQKKVCGLWDQQFVLRQRAAIERMFNAKEMNLVNEAAKVLKKMKEDVDAHRNNKEVRRAPFVVCFAGNPGVGKSVLLNLFAQRLFPEEKLAEYKDNFLFCRNEGVRYWNGYRKQPVVIIDDWGQVKKESSESDSFTELIGMKTNAIFPLPMAKIEDKELCFESVVVLHATNGPFVIPTTLQHHKACWRRRDFLIKVEVPRDLLLDPREPEGGVSFAKVRERCEQLKPGENNMTAHYRFTMIKPCPNVAGEVVIEGPYDFDQLTVRMRLEFDKYQKQQEFIVNSKANNMVADEEFQAKIDRIYERLGIDPLGMMVGHADPGRRAFDAIIAAGAVDYQAPVIQGQAGFDLEYHCGQCHACLLTAEGVPTECRWKDRVAGSGVHQQQPESSGVVKEMVQDFWKQKIERAKVHFAEHIVKYEFFAKMSMISLIIFGLVGVVIAAVSLYRRFRPPGPQSGHEIRTAKMAMRYNPRIVANAGYNLQGDAGALELSRNISNSVISITREENGHVAFTNATMLKGTVCVVPSHFFMDPKTCEYIASGSELTIRSAGRVIIKDEFQKDRLFLMKDHDLALYCFTSNVQPYPNLVKKHVIRTSDLPTLSAKGCGMMVTLDRTNGTVLKTMSMIEPIDREYHYSINEKVAPEQFYLRQGWRYDVMTMVGDCGAPVIACNTHLTRKIIGFHIAGYPGRAGGFAEILDFEKLSEAISQVEERCGKLVYMNVQHPDLTEEFEDLKIVPCGNFTITGAMPRHLSPRQPCKTDIKESLIHGIIDEPITGPSVLSDKDPRLIEKCSPLAKAVNKYGGVSPSIARERLQEVKVALQKEFCEIQSSVEPRVLTEFEAINGVAGMEYAEGLNMQSSAGFPWSMRRKMSEETGKLFLFDGEPGQYVAKQELQEAIDERIKKAQKGKRVPSIWIDQMKVERRLLSKIEAGSTRVFTMSPVDFSIVFRKYFLMFEVHFMQTRIKTSSIVGINPASPEWTDLFEKLAHVSDKGFCADYSRFDGSIPLCLIQLVLEIINEWYNDSEENQLIRRVLFSEIMHTNQLVMNVSYFTHIGNPSGCPITTVLNTLVGRAYNYLVWFAVAPVGKNLQWFVENVKAGIYGDDLAVSAKRELEEVYNLRSFNEVLGQYGISVTHPNKQKVEDAKYEDLSKATLLKCGFSVQGNQVYPLMEEANAREIVNWIRESPDDVKATEDNCNAALRHIFFYGRKKYEEFRTELREAAKMAKVQFSLTHFSELLHDFKQIGFVFNDEFLDVQDKVCFLDGKDWLSRAKELRPIQNLRKSAYLPSWL